RGVQLAERVGVLENMNRHAVRGQTLDDALEPDAASRADCGDEDLLSVRERGPPAEVTFDDGPPQGDAAQRAMATGTLGYVVVKMEVCGGGRCIVGGMNPAGAIERHRSVPWRPPPEPQVNASGRL